MAVQTGIRGEGQLAWLARMCALRHAGVAADALQTHDQVSAVGEIVWLRCQSDGREKRRPGSTE